MFRKQFLSALTISAALAFTTPAIADDNAGSAAISVKPGVTLTNAGKTASDAAKPDSGKSTISGDSALPSSFLDSMNAVRADAAGAPEVSGNLLTEPPATPAAAENPLANPPTKPTDARKFLFGSRPASFSEESYADSVAKLFAAFEAKTELPVKPGKLGKVGLKIYTASGPGLATPKNLVRAVIKELEKRGFAHDKIFLLDLSDKSIRDAGYLPKLPAEGENFDGIPVLALDSEKYYNAKWVYANPLPSKEIVARAGDYSLAYTQADKMSPLPMPLMFDCDFWINLPVATDSPALGISAALGNATIWNMGNQRRFLDNAANAQKAAVEIAAIPEFHEKFLFSVVSLERYQYIGGPNFDANFCLSENRVWLSGNPLILDFLLMQRMNAAREKQGLPEISEPSMFLMGNTAPIYLGSCVPSEINLIQVDSEKK